VSDEILRFEGDTNPQGLKPNHPDTGFGTAEAVPHPGVANSHVHRRLALENARMESSSMLRRL
jgi:hypothetical protein